MNNYMKIIINAIKQWVNEKLIELDANLNEKIAPLNEGLNNKVDMVEGKGLSTEDYTTEEKDKLSRTVMSVNGEKPDAVGNVDIAIPEPDTVLDENGKLLRSVLPEGYPYAEKAGILLYSEDVGEVRAYQVDGYVPEILADGIACECRDSGGSTLQTIHKVSDTVYVAGDYFPPFAYYATTDGAKFDEITFPAKGTYYVGAVLYTGEMVEFTKSVSFPDYDEEPVIGWDGFVQETVVPLDPKFLPEGYPYEAIKIVNEPLYITWDGNTEGLEYFDGLHGYKVSDAVLTEEILLNAEIYVTNINTGKGDFVGDERTIENPDDGVFLLSGSMVGKPNYYMVITINEQAASELGLSAGTYFAFAGNLYVSSLTTTEPMEHIKKVAVPMAEKFLPEFGGGVKFTHISEDEEGNLTSSMTYVEIAEALRGGSMVYCTYSIWGNNLMMPLIKSAALGPIMPLAVSDSSHAFGTVYWDTYYGVSIEDTETVSFDSMQLVEHRVS